MDPGPKVAISEFVLNGVDNESSIRLLSATFKLKFLQNGQYLCDSGPMVQNDDGCQCPVADFRLILRAIDILVIDVFNANDDLKLGSVYLDLEDELPPLTGSDSLHTYNVIMESDDFPTMQLALKASSFPPSSMPPATPAILNILVFTVCPEETTDTNFQMYCLELCKLLTTGLFLILHRESFLKLRDRCRAMASAKERVLLFILFAGVLDCQFHATSDKWIYSASCLLFDDFTANLHDLDRPTQLTVASLITSLSDTPTTARFMQLFAKFLIDRHHTTANEDDLNQAISLLEAEECLRASLSSHRRTTVDEDDLNHCQGISSMISRLEAAEHLRAGLSSHDFDFDHLYMYAIMYDAYNTRYLLFKKIPDLDRAVESLSKAVELPLPQVMQSKVLHSLAVMLVKRFRRLDAEADITRAMICINRALEGVLIGNPEYQEYRDTLKEILWARFDYSKDEGDYVQAMKILEEQIADVEGLNNSEAKQDLVNLLFFQFLKKRSKGYEEHRKQHSADADEDLTVFIKHEAQRASEEDVDLMQAIDLYREVANGGFNEGKSLSRALIMRFVCRRDKADLDEAIDIMSRMSDKSRDDLDLGETLFIRYEYCGGALEDLYSALSYASHVATSVDLDLTKRLEATWFWILLLAKLESHADYDPSQAILPSIIMAAFENIISIIPSIAWIGRPMQDRHDILMTQGVIPMPSTAVRKRTMPRELLVSAGHAPSIAAAFAIYVGMFHTAVEWLERGRSIIWDQLLQFRVSLDKLSQEAPGLAQKLSVLAKDLSKSSTTTQFWHTQVVDGEEAIISLEDQGQTHRRLATEWEEAAADVRKLPGFDKFLLPKDFDYLSKAANDSIVAIINVNGLGDALIIFPGSAKKDVRHVPLPGLTGDDVEQMHADLLSLIRDDMGIRSELTRKPVLRDFLAGRNASFKKILTDLWYKIVRPVICEAMEYSPSLVNCDDGEKRAHMRWCPTGRLAFLPLHAAGDYSLSGKGHRVFDFVVSSYIPTLNSVIRTTSPTSNQEMIKVLAVACPNAKGQVPIPDTEEEVNRVRRHVVPLLDQPATPVSRYTALVKKTATAERVLEEMKEATWVHLACHGFQDATSPTRSALLLSGGTRLSLSDIAALDLPQAELAFLSACQTATGYDKVPSESVHLAAGMLLAGYRSVIGTMWSIADRHAPHVADDVYGYLLRDGTSRRPDYKESALALHLAMEKLRARIGEGSFLKWVPYIHMGI